MEDIKIFTPFTVLGGHKMFINAIQAKFLKEFSPKDLYFSFDNDKEQTESFHREEDYYFRYKPNSFAEILSGYFGEEAPQREIKFLDTYSEAKFMTVSQLIRLLFRGYGNSSHRKEQIQVVVGEDKSMAFNQLSEEQFEAFLLAAMKQELQLD